MSDRNERSRTRSGACRWALWLALAFSAGALGACDEVLDVELPGQITADQTFEPTQAEVLVNSAIGEMECSMSEFIAMNGAGNADALHRTIGWWNGSHEYEPNPDTDRCSTGENQYGWWTPLQSGRWLAEQVYARMDTVWSADEVEDRERLMATAAVYVGHAYAQLGQFFCEVSANTGPLMAWDESLGVAEEWYGKALSHIGAAGDFAITPGVTESARQLTYLLRARARLAKGDMAGAATDAEQVQQGFIAYITREAGGERKRWNRVFSSHNQAGWSTLVGPIDWWSGPPNPATGEEWPAVIPFTGYWNLAVLPDGRAVSGTGHPVTTDDDPAAVEDPRVQGQPTGGTAGPEEYPRWQQTKYTSLGDDFPFAKWEEAWLIRAEAAGGQTAIDLVNDVRAAHGLPEVTYLAASDAEGIEDMIIEENRRTHFLEGRFWSTKLRHIDKLWFPRGHGQAVVHNYNQGVRMVMPNSEYELNPNFDQSARGSLCPANQAPVL